MGKCGTRCIAPCSDAWGGVVHRRDASQMNLDYGDRRKRSMCTCPGNTQWGIVCDVAVLLQSAIYIICMQPRHIVQMLL